MLKLFLMTALLMFCSSASAAESRYEALKFCSSWESKGDYFKEETGIKKVPNPSYNDWQVKYKNKVPSITKALQREWFRKNNIKLNFPIKLNPNQTKELLEFVKINRDNKTLVNSLLIKENKDIPDKPLKFIYKSYTKEISYNDRSCIEDSPTRQIIGIEKGKVKKRFKY